MPKLSELNPDDVEVLHTPGTAAAKPMKLSDLNPDDVEHVAYPTPVPAKPEGLSAVWDHVKGRAGELVDDLKSGANSVIHGHLPIGESIPLVGPLAEKAGNATAAGLAAVYPGKKSYGEYYDEFSKKADDGEKAYDKEHPWASGLSHAAGAVALPLPPALKAAEGAGALARGGTALANSTIRVGTNTALEAGDAALRGHDPVEAAKRAASVTGLLEGAGLAAGATRALSGALKPTVESAAGRMAGTAERKAFKAAVGNNQKVYDDMERQGRINTIGRDALDHDVVRFGSSPRTIAGRAQAMEDQAGKEIGAIVDEASKAGGVADGPAIARKIRTYIEKIRSPKNRAVMADLESQAAEFEAMGMMPLTEAQRLKNTYKWDPRDPSTMALPKDATNNIKRGITGEMDKGVGAVATGGSADPDLLKKYLEKKRKFGSMTTLAPAAEKHANRLEKNRSLSLTDHLMSLMGIGGAAAVGMAHSPGTAILTGTLAAGAGLGNKVLRERGNSMLAVTLDSASKMLKASPDALGKYAGVLQSAANRGSLPVTHALLMQQDPDYQKIILQNPGAVSE